MDLNWYNEIYLIAGFAGDPRGGGGEHFPHPDGPGQAGHQVSIQDRQFYLVAKFPAIPFPGYLYLHNLYCIILYWKCWCTHNGVNAFLKGTILQFIFCHKSGYHGAHVCMAAADSAVVLLELDVQ